MREILVIVLLATFAPKIQAQQHQARDWYCVRQAFAETTDGDVVVLQCVAALPKNEKLDAGTRTFWANLKGFVGTLKSLPAKATK